MNKVTAAFAAIAWLATLALAFVIGRETVSSHAPDPLPSPTVSAAAAAPTPPPSPTPTPTASPTPSYPRYSSTIPSAFRGRWDEIVSDGCAEREARFNLLAATMFNFEVEQNVSRVKLYSPTEIDIDVTGYDDDKNQYNDTWSLKLIDGGKTLTGRKAGASNFRKCPRHTAS
ncbi:hypothetical protein FHT00_003631 [Sphingomonas insulae]|nr:hypothetical protein [Sphingomonas insulae]NIJ31644.1 hypothetical protein [Sphingomonas insulae]